MIDVLISSLLTAFMGQTQRSADGTTHIAGPLQMLTGIS